MAEADQPEDDEAGRRKTGTYLFVKEGRVRRPAGAFTPPREPQRPILPEDSLVGRQLAAEPIRLRHRRPTLQPGRLDRHLCFFLAPDGEAAQAYREAARHLLAGLGDARRVLVTSAGRGAGRTTTCVNLASALAETHRVTVVDVDAARPGLAAAFALVADAWTEAAKAALLDPRRALDVVLVADHLGLLPLAPGVSAETFAALGPALDCVRDASDVVLLDGPPVLTEGVAHLEGLYDAVLIVVRPDDLARGRLEKVIAALEGVPIVGALVNDSP